MGAILNGMALHGGVIPYGGTFLVFADYMRPSIRLAALMQTHTLFIFTHDSLGVGEDGPTHQPVEHVASLRAIPGLKVLRPADANETAQAWALALDSPGPSVLILTRQKLPILDLAQYPVAQGAPKGAYVLSDCQDNPKLLLLATGSEVALALETQKALAEKNVPARVISMPCWEIFAAQPQEYQDQVLPPAVTARLAIEAGISMGWRQWTGDHGDIISVEKFGHSAPGGTVLSNYGFNLENAVSKALALL
jgi:transketolase